MSQKDVKRTYTHSLTQSTRMAWYQQLIAIYFCSTCVQRCSLYLLTHARTHARTHQLQFFWQGRASKTVQCIAFCLQLRCTLLYCNLDCSHTHTVQSLGPLSVNYLGHCWSAIVFRVIRAVISLLPNIRWCHWSWIFCFVGQLQWPNLLSSPGCWH